MAQRTSTASGVAPKGVKPRNPIKNHAAAWFVQCVYLVRPALWAIAYFWMIRLPGRLCR